MAEKRTLIEALGIDAVFCTLREKDSTYMVYDRQERRASNGKIYVQVFAHFKDNPNEIGLTGFVYHSKDGWSLQEAKTHCEDCGGSVVGEEFYPEHKNGERS